LTNLQRRRFRTTCDVLTDGDPVLGLEDPSHYLNALMPFSEYQHNILAHAVNERLDELPPARAPYY